jgi:hypothetical protein
MAKAKLNEEAGGKGHEEETRKRGRRRDLFNNSPLSPLSPCSPAPLPLTQAVLQFDGNGLNFGILMQAIFA